MGRCHSMELDLAWHDSHDWCWKTKSDPSRDQCDISHSLMFERGKDPSRVAARFVSFLFDESKSPFGQEVDGWDTDCPSWMPGGRSHTKGFCRKIPPPKRTWFPPENPEPRGQTAPTATSAPSAPSAPGASAPVHRTHVEKPQLPWELPAATVRQEQKLVVEEPEVPFTAPEVRPAPQISSTKRMQKKIEKHEEMGPQFQSPDEIQDVADVAPPPKPPPHVEVDPGKPRPPLIVEQKTSKPSKSPEIGIVEEEVSPEEQMFDAAPQCQFWAGCQFTFRVLNNFFVQCEKSVFCLHSLFSMDFISLYLSDWLCRCSWNSWLG